MDQAYWHRQTDKPLFPELEWSRPETRTQAGKLLVVGGHAAGFTAPATAYNEALKADVGSVRVLLPESLRKSVSKVFLEAEFAPSTPSGSFATQALAELIDAGAWANGLLFPGDLSRNSETTALLETFLEKYPGRVTLTNDAADVLIDQPVELLQREHTLFVLNLDQLRQLGNNAHFPRAFTSTLGLVQLVEGLHEFTKRVRIAVITKHQNHYIVALDGQVSTTAVTTDKHVWRLAAAAHASVWWLQNPTKPLAALTAAIFSYNT